MSSCHTRNRTVAVDRVLTEYSGLRHFDRLEELLDHGLDALVVASPRRAHAEHIGGALDRSIPVLVEKPTATDPAAVERLHRRARQHRVLLRTGYTILSDTTFDAFRSMSSAHGANRFLWSWRKPLPSYDCTEIVWEFFPHVCAVLRVLCKDLRGEPLVAAVTGGAVSAAGGPRRSGEVRLRVAGGSTAEFEVVVSTRPDVVRHKRLLAYRDGEPVAEWTDRRARDLLSGTTVRGDDEPLSRQLSLFLRDAARSAPADGIESDLDSDVARMLEHLGRNVVH